jgi:hypothetical protein
VAVATAGEGMSSEFGVGGYDPPEEEDEEEEEEGLDGSRGGTRRVRGAGWWTWMAGMRCPCDDSATADRLSW